MENQSSAVNMEQLFDEQANLGRSLENMLINFGKDSSTRKTEEYLKKRLEQAEAYWLTFESNHAKLLPLQETHQDNSYFMNNYFEKLQKLYQRFKALLLQWQGKLKQPVPVVPSTSSDEEKNDKNDKFTLLSERDDKKNTDDEVQRLIRKQKALMRTVTHLIQDIEAKVTQEFAVPYYELKIKMLQNYEMELVNTDQLIWENSLDEKPWGYEAALFYELDDWVQDTIVSLQQRLATLVQATTIAPTNIKLPQIVLPTFDGNYLKWTEFYDLYVQLIHSQLISNSQKMFYLTTSLTGEAKTLIQHLPVSNQNYEAAWTILTNRYSNKRLLVTAFLNKFLSQPASQIESAANIKALHDITTECLLGLKNLGISIDSWDPLLVHLIIKKFDKNTHVLYEQSLESPRELNSIQNVLKFLETRFQSLEALGGKNLRQGQQMKSSAFVATTNTSQATTNGNQCIACKQNHPLYSCNDFLARSPADRHQFLRKHQLCFNCMRGGHSATSCTLRGCRRCSKKHNSLIHPQDNQKRQSNASRAHSQNPTGKPHASKTSQEEETDTRQSPSINSIALAAQPAKATRGYVLLSTVIVILKNNEGKEVECRAVLDSGSQINLITQRLAKKLALKEIVDSLSIQGIGRGVQKTEHRINVTLQSKTTGFKTRIEAFILPQITTSHPLQQLDTSSWAIPNNIELADPSFHRPSRVDLLIGAEHYFQLLAIGQIKLGDKLPVLQNTVLGWVVAGKIQNTVRYSATCGICTEEEDKLNRRVERFWKLEEVEAVTSTMTAAELKCENHFNQTMRRNDEGRFIVRLPFSKDSKHLGESRDIALNRFYSLEKKLNKDPALRQQYSDFIKEYIDLGHMEEVRMTDIPRPYYVLPHHCVIKPDSTTTKLRVVFDASMKTSSNTSLNDILLTGPSIQDELFSILLRFRLPRFVFTADIAKMYRQILIDKDDRKYQLIFWRNSQSEPVRTYQLNTVTYGVTTAPYLATKCLQRLALQTGEKYPLGSSSLKRDFYVDDLMTGSDSLREAMETQDQLIKILHSAGFNLRKWCANHPSLLENIPPSERALQLELLDDNDCHVKTLGLIWSPTRDEFSFKTEWIEEKRVTKRIVLSEIAHLFDPLGLLSPVVVSAKIFLQKLWELKLDWDAALPMNLHTSWIHFRKALKNLNQITVPRHISQGKKLQSRQLHAFSDASEKAYGSAIYVRSIFQDGTILVRLLCAKSRVSPIKATTLPRLELCAAKLTALLLHRVKGDLKWNEPCYLWTDSEIVLAWLNSQSTSYHTFVANRIAAIQELTSPSQWRHVPSKHNPADLVSRGINPEKLKDNNLWFYGPLFLHGRESGWPNKLNTETNLEKKKPNIVLKVVTATTSMLETIDHRNSFNRLQRVIAYILRFVKNTQQPHCKEKSVHLSVQELEEALLLIVKQTQAEEFAEELTQLKRSGCVNNNSSLISLSPFLDERDIIRVGGRLEQAQLSYDAKHPMLLPYAHYTTRLLMQQQHDSNHHIGPQALLAMIRQKFWPIKGKTIARSIVQNCVRCNRSKPKLLEQFMGSLPAHRVQPSRPFINTGLDFCGPFLTHFKLRGKRPQKTYVAIFCCFATKAIHIEVVSDLTSDAFIGALKRFVSRRGNCKNIYCDNATNFVGTSNKFKELQDAIHSKEAKENITRYCTQRNVDFHFIPPRAPHFGGLWEAAVKSAKHLFEKSVAAASLTYEELETVMIEIEAILNSRPLTPMSSSPNDLSALTPGHFLIGEPPTSLVDPHAEPSKTSLLQRWRMVAHLKKEFWRRWSKEYLSELQHRYKWKQRCNNVQPGTMVILKDDNLPALSWPLGRILQTFKGDDGLVRVADVKTATGVLRRPIHKLAPLPLEQKEQNCSQPEISPQGISTEAEDSDLPNTTENNPGPAAKRPRRNNAFMSLCLLTCLVMPILGSTEINVTNFKTQPGIYFEGIGPTHLVTNEWNMVIYYDLKPYWKELETILNGISTLAQLCSTMKEKQTCAQTLNQFYTMRSELRNNNELLTFQTPVRTKRAPLDIVGNIANSLFGVLDSKYAEGMSEIISNLEGNQDHLLELLKNQTSIIDSTANIIRSSTDLIQGQITELSSEINQTMSQMNILRQELSDQKTTETFNALSIRLILAITNYQRMQSLLLDVIIDTHHGKMNPLLLAPRQLQAQLLLIKDNLPPTLRLPASRNNLLELYSLMAIEGRVTVNQMIFRIKLPLFSYEQFELLRIIPVPTLVNNTFLAIQPSTRFMIVNLHRDQYYPLSDQELSMCTTIRHSVHMCRQHHPIYRKGSSICACELGLLTQVPSPSSCKVSKSDEVPRWIQLLNPNHWIYVMKEERTINVVCENSVFQRALRGSGILTLRNGCTIKDEGTTIQAHNLYPSTLRTSFIPTTNLTDLLQPFEMSELLQQPLSKQNVSNDISSLKEKINQLQVAEGHPLRTPHQDVHHFSIGYSSLSIAVMVSVYLIWRHYRHRQQTHRTSPEAPVPAPRKKSTDFCLSMEAEEIVELGVQRGGGC